MFVRLLHAGILSTPLNIGSIFFNCNSNFSIPNSMAIFWWSGSRVSSLVIQRPSESETSTLCTPKSTTVSRNAVYLGQSCSFHTLRTFWWLLLDTVSVLIHMLMTLSLMYTQLPTTDDSIWTPDIMQWNHCLDDFKQTEIKHRKNPVHLSWYIISTCQSRCFRHRRQWRSRQSPAFCHLLWR